MIKDLILILTVSLLIGDCDTTQLPDNPIGDNINNIVVKNRYIIKNARLIYYNAEPDFTLVNPDILIENQIIKEISENIEEQEGDFVIDGSGKYIIPALYDLHTHAIEENDLFLYVANGVTTIRHMWGNDALLAIRAEIDNGDLIGPKLFLASPGFEQPPSYWPNTVLIENSDLIGSQVAKQIEKGFDFIKIYENLSFENYSKIVEESSAQGIRTVGHIPHSVTLDDVLEGNSQASIEHFDSYFESINTNGTSISNPINYSIDEEKLNSVISKTLKSDVWNCPTITITTRHSGQLDQLKNNPELHYVSPRMRSWFSSPGANLNSWNADEYTKHKLQLIRKFYEHQVPMILGTDTGLRYILPGFSVHEELANFVKAGIPEIEALKIATVNCANFLRIENQGKIEVGYNAELVLLDKNPLENIENTKEIFAVISQGRYLSKAYLHQRLEEIKTSYSR